MFDLSQIPSRADLLARFERQRRRTLVRIIAPIFAVLSFGSVFSGVPGSAAWVGFAIAAASVVLAALLVGAFVAAQRDLVNLGVLLTLVSVDAIIILTEILPLQPGGLEVNTLFQYLAFGIAIVLAGLLAETWVIVATTAVLCGFSTGILLWYGTQSTPSPLTRGLALTMNGNLTLLVTINLVFLLAFAGLTYAFRRGFTNILYNLSDITQQFERAKQLDELKTLFIRNVNHELRNPVMALLGYMEGLRFAAPAEASPRFRRYLDETEQVVHNLRDLINAVLDVRQVENPENAEVTLQPVDLR